MFGLHQTIGKLSQFLLLPGQKMVFISAAIQRWEWKWRHHNGSRFVYCILPSHNPFSWNCRYHRRVLLGDSGSLLNFLLNSRCTVITDCDLANCSTQNDFCYAVAFFIPSAVWRLKKKHSFNRIWKNSDSLPIVWCVLKIFTFANT
jgi:hypothetical protein